MPTGTPYPKEHREFIGETFKTALELYKDERGPRGKAAEMTVEEFFKKFPEAISYTNNKKVRQQCFNLVPGESRGTRKGKKSVEVRSFVDDIEPEYVVLYKPDGSEGVRPILVSNKAALDTKIEEIMEKDHGKPSISVYQRRRIKQHVSYDFDD